MRGVLFALLLSLCQICAAEKPKIVFLAGEYEYDSKKTLPVFAADLKKQFVLETIVLQRCNG